MEPRVRLYVLRKESFSIPVKYIDVTRNTHTSIDVMLEKSIDDYWNVDGYRELSDTWTGFTRFTSLSEKPPDGFSWSGEETAKKTNDLQARHFVARNVDTYVRCIKTQR